MARKTGGLRYSRMLRGITARSPGRALHPARNALAAEIDYELPVAISLRLDRRRQRTLESEQIARVCPRMRFRSGSRGHTNQRLRLFEGEYRVTDHDSLNADVDAVGASPQSRSQKMVDVLAPRRLEAAIRILPVHRVNTFADQ